MVAVSVGVPSIVGSRELPADTCSQAEIHRGCADQQNDHQRAKRCRQAECDLWHAAGLHGIFGFFDFTAAFAVSSVPHTRQRVAFSLRRVPQVGHIFDF